MDERNQAGREGRLPNEIVETYRRPASRHLPGERVLTYRRPPASGLTPAAGPEHGGRQEETASPRRKRRRRGLWIFLACFAGIVLLAGVSLLLEGRSTEIREDPFEQHYDEEPIHETSGEITIPTWPSGQGGSLTLRLDHGAVLTAQEVYQAVNPAVVMVMAQLEDGVSVGTGVIFSSDGYILTNYHVLEGGSECVVVLDTGIQYTARYVGGDQDNDLAVLKVDAEGLPTAEFGDSDLLTVGDTVYAIGNPLGVELRGTLTDGLVSAIDRDVVVDGRVMTLIQTNAALNSGNSGGPLINQYGQVVGINVIKMTSEYSNVEGLGFAIPSTSVERITNDILTWGEAQPEPLLGVTVYQEGVQLGTDLWGLEVIDVTRGSAAARAGIQVGDYILSAGGEELRTSRDLLRVRRHCYVGDELSMVLWRDGERLEVVLELQESLR